MIIQGGENSQMETTHYLSQGKKNKDDLRTCRQVDKSKFANSLITVITVVFNGNDSLEETIQSVINQTYDNVEYIVIDGGSTDGTLDIIKQHEGKIDRWLSEEDSGIYDAMNKGINLANGEWINFMNSGDVFHDNDVLLNFYKESKKYQNIDFFYSDSIVRNGKKYICNKEKRILIHQAIIYRKAIHEKIGRYVVVKNLTTADYFFFMLSYNYNWQKLIFPISIHDTNGISSGLHTFLQKNAIDLLFGFNGRIKTILFLSAHPFYNKIKTLFK